MRYQLKITAADNTCMLRLSTEHSSIYCSFYGLSIEDNSIFYCRKLELSTEDSSSQYHTHFGATKTYLLTCTYAEDNKFTESLLINSEVTTDNHSS